MAVKNQGNLNNTPNLYTGLSTDTKLGSATLKSEFSETDTGSWFRFNGAAWVEFAGPTSDNKNAGLVKVADRPANAENLNYKDTFSGTGTALGTTSSGVCNSLGLPFDSLTFTASGAVNQVDVDVHFVAGGGIVNIRALNGDTIDISASTGSQSFVPLLRNSSGAIIAATDANLTATGIYYLYLGD